MQVIVDGDAGFPIGGKVTDALSAVIAVGRALRRKGRAILSVGADGRNILHEALVQTLGGAAPEAIGRLEIRSAEIARLVEDALNDLHEALTELPTACHKLAEIFHGEAPEEGYDLFEKLAGIWGNIKAREAEVANALDLSLDTLCIDGLSIAALHVVLNDFLNEAAEALKAGDCVLLGDLLEYELAPRAEHEAQIVALLEHHAQERAT